MSFNTHRFPSVVRIALFTAISTVLGSLPAHADQGNDAGAKLVNEVCTSCHGLAPIETVRNGPGGWRSTVFDMVDKGAQIQSQAELDSIVSYLSTAYGPSAGEMHTGPLPAGSSVKSDGTTAKDYLAVLPAANGADLVKGYCSICHDVGRIVATRRSAEEWQRYTNVMLARIGSPANKKVSDTIAAYLASNFGTTEHKPR